MECYFGGIKPVMRKGLAIFNLALLGMALGSAAPRSLCAQQSKMPDPWQGSGKQAWPKPDWLEGTSRRLEKAKTINQPGSEVEMLVARTSELLDQAKQARENQFRSGRLLMAANALLDAADRIFWARKAERTRQDQDFWGAGFILQGCYFRVRQANYFAELSGDKGSEQYVTLSRSLYQQGRSAYDAREYQRARLLGDASSSVVFALECIAQATTPDPHIYK